MRKSLTQLLLPTCEGEGSTVEVQVNLKNSRGTTYIHSSYESLSILIQKTTILQKHLPHPHFPETLNKYTPSLSLYVFNYITDHNQHINNNNFIACKLFGWDIKNTHLRRFRQIFKRYTQNLHVKVQVRYSISNQVNCSFCFLSVTEKCMRLVEFSADKKN